MEPKAYQDHTLEHILGDFLEDFPEVPNVHLPRSRLIILGAGFSKPAGLPLAKDLLKSVRVNLKRLNTSNELEREIAEWQSLYPSDCVNLERVLAYSHRKHHLRLLGSDKLPDHASISISDVQMEIQRILIELSPVGNDIPVLYRRFAELLTPHDVVLTFNYDTLLEDTLGAIGKTYSLVPKWLLENVSDDHRPDCVELLKLHGSIDWYDRYYYDCERKWQEKLRQPDRDPIFGPNPLVRSENIFSGSIARQPPWEKSYGLLSRVVRVPNLKEHFPIQESRYRCAPFLLPPAYDKLLGYDPIIDLWAGLHRTPQRFSSIVVIGYSMPSYDSYAYEGLGKLMLDYQRGADQKVYGQRRLPIQNITLAKSEDQALVGAPFLERDKTRVWYEGFSSESLDWLDWGDDGA